MILSDLLPVLYPTEGLRVVDTKGYEVFEGTARQLSALEKIKNRKIVEMQTELIYGIRLWVE